MTSADTELVLPTRNVVTGDDKIVGMGNGSNTTFEERFWSKVDKYGECWVWTGRKVTGYGSINIGPKRPYAHRIAYEMLVGPIPPGLEVDHICINRACVRPEHLRLTTRKQNMENRNRPNRNSTTGVRGVIKRPYGWVVAISHYGKTSTYGSYRTLAEAEAVAISTRNKLFTHNDSDRSMP